MATNYNLYDIIRNLCNERNISIAELERKLLFSSSTIYRWQSSTPSYDKLILVADQLNVSLDYLTGRSSIRQSSDDLVQDYASISVQSAMDKMNDNEKERMLKLLKVAFEDKFS